MNEIDPTGQGVGPKDTRVPPGVIITVCYSLHLLPCDVVDLQADITGLGDIEDDRRGRVEGIRIRGMDLVVGYYRIRLGLLHSSSPLGNLQHLEMGVVGKVDAPTGQSDTSDVDPRRPVIGNLLGRGLVGNIVDTQADPPAVGDIDGIPR